MFQPEEKDNIVPVEKTIQESLDTMTKEEPLELSQNQGNSTKALLLWKASQITDRHRDFKPEHSTNHEWNNQWLKLSNVLGSGMLVVILGNRGAGKSQMAVCAIRQSCKNLKSARYEKALNFFLDVRKTFKTNSEKSERDVIKSYCEPFLLVVDAIENRGETPFENLLLNYLIDLRYDQCKDTILIGNQNENEFAASMGPSIIDRIHECGIKIICSWKSFRRA
jgi:DNA replication protein DnaC